MRLINMAPGNQTGYTFIELVIAVSIVTMLFSMAIPAYNSSVEKSRRTDGKAALLDVAARQEKYFFSNNQYACSVVTLGVSATNPMPASNGFYNVSIQGGCTTTAYVAQAVPTGAQAKDTKCATLTLSSTGVKGITGSGSVADCW